MADKHNAPEIEMGDKSGEIVRQSVVIITMTRMVRSSVTPSIIGDASQAVLR